MSGHYRKVVKAFGNLIKLSGLPGRDALALSLVKKLLTIH